MIWVGIALLLSGFGLLRYAEREALVDFGFVCTCGGMGCLVLNYLYG